MTGPARTIEVPGSRSPERAGPGFAARRILGYGLLLAALVGCPGERPERAGGDRPGQAEASDTEILWDEWGVPHIFAESETDLFRAHGWAQMQSHGDRILILYEIGRAHV